jgi:16S rRNA (cytidine1402-2'-O)-methyltransferase
LLYIVATPIGNLEDITLRALRVLRDEVGVIACEDTRQTRKLAERYEIRKPLLSYHEHNEQQRIAELLERLNNGEHVALVSDAGTPLISDPGYRLVAAAVARGITVVPIPGANAAVSALSASGLPTDDFRFAGFLPPKSAVRRKLLESLRGERATLIFYETPHRIIESLVDIDEVLGHRQIVLARELTKLHEEFLRGTALEIADTLRARPAIKGEITLLVERAGNRATEGDPVVEVQKAEQSGMNRMDAIKSVARRFGIGKRELYRQITGHD